MIKNKTVIQVLSRLQQNDRNAVIFGGYIRDIYIGAEPKDIDILTNLTVNELLLIFPFAENRKTLSELDIVFFQKNNLFFEIITTNGSIIEKVSESDLTANTLLYDGKQIIDTTTAIADIDAGILKFTNKDSYIKNISSSPHGWIKPFRLSAKLNFILEDSLLKTLTDTKYLFSDIPSSIKNEEAYKILSTGQPLEALKNLSKTGLISNFNNTLDNTFDLHKNLKNQHHLTLCLMASLVNKEIVDEFIHQFDLPQNLKDRFSKLFYFIQADELPTDYRTLNEILFLKRLL